MTQISANAELPRRLRMVTLSIVRRSSCQGRKATTLENFRKALASDSTNTVAYEYLRYVH